MSQPGAGAASAGPRGSDGSGAGLVTAPKLPDTNSPLDGHRTDAISAMFGNLLSAKPQGAPGAAQESGDGEAPLIPSISTPKGGGALTGIDEKFNVNAFTGTAGSGPLLFYWIVRCSSRSPFPISRTSQNTR